MSATVLPAATAMTDASVNEGQFKTALTSFHDFVSELQTKAADVASASTTNIGAAAGNYCRITGTTTITAFDNPTAAPNVTRIVQFTGALTLTHNATSLIMPGGANITTAAGDIAYFVHEGSGNWRCLWYARNAAPLVDGSGNLLIGVSSGSQHNLRKDIAGAVVNVTNGHASTPYGQGISYPNAAPNNTSQEFIYGSDSGTTRFALRSNGGLANYSANNVNLSDESVKNVFGALPSYWDKWKLLEFVLYAYKDQQDQEDTNIGLVAQQVEAVAPEFVAEGGFTKRDKDGNHVETGQAALKSIYETDLFYTMGAVLQEAQHKIEVLTAEVATLKGA